jgi:hypothetical protein
MIERLLLGIILIVVLVIILRAVRRTVARSADDSKPPACAGCPFDSKCEMQDKPHVSSCGSDAGE